MERRMISTTICNPQRPVDSKCRSQQLRQQSLIQQQIPMREIQRRSILVPVVIVVVFFLKSYLPMRQQ